MIKGEVERITGPVVVAKGMLGAKMWDVVKIGKAELLGEVIRLARDKAVVEVYEDTNNLQIGEQVVSLDKPFSVELGPGLVGSVFDGLQRPLDKIKDDFGDFIKKGIRILALNRKTKWEFEPKVKKNDKVSHGDVIGVVKEGLINHKILAPFGVSGEAKTIRSGKFSVEDVVCELKNGQKISLMHEWDIRRIRPYKMKIDFSEILVTGQRSIDFLFPVAKGGNVCIPGGFGAGKTVLESVITQNCDSDINIICRAGERGNEVVDIINEINEMKDRSGKSLIKKSILIANTSNMPVVARETSISTAMTIGEYFRDQGLNAVVLVDSTSRWAEALREVSGRLEELPGEEGYPVYLESDVDKFYERSGRFENLNGSIGTLTLLSSVSPPGADFSEPVTQASLRIAKVFWGLDQKLAWRRHFPAINWLISYSNYLNELSDWFSGISKDWPEVRKKVMNILRKEDELDRVVRVVGINVLPAKERFTLEIAKIIREDFLQQSAYDPADAYTKPEKQYMMVKSIVDFYEDGLKQIESGKEIDDVLTKDAKGKFADMRHEK
jgi:V/A-type H+-transporting ATPase subunit A